MSGNTFGTLFCVTSFGESHGPAIGCVVDGCPPGLALAESDIQHDLDRRKPGTSRHVTQRRESDTVEILSGVFDGRTTGTPIALLIRNEDARSKDYANIAETFRPGHADYTYWHKYGIRDYRGGGRQSARETAVRVAAGAIARKWLGERYGVVVRGHMTHLGENAIPFEGFEHIDSNPFFAANRSIVGELETFMDKLRKAGDSCGARIEVRATGVPVGWGEPVYGKLDADIAHAMMGINAVKGVEIGAGFASVAQRGTVHSDEIAPEGFLVELLRVDIEDDRSWRRDPGGVARCSLGGKRRRRLGSRQAHADRAAGCIVRNRRLCEAGRQEGRERGARNAHLVDGVHQVRAEVAHRARAHHPLARREHGGHCVA